MSNFIEVTVVADSTTPFVEPRKALLRVDWITTVLDVLESGRDHGYSTAIDTQQTVDYQEDDDNAPVIRAHRTFYVQDSYEVIRTLIQKASTS